MSKSPRSSILQFIVLFALLYVGSQFFLRTFFPDQFSNQPPRTGVSISAVDSTVKGDHHPVLTVRNDTDEILELEDRCPMPPVNVFFVEEGNERRELTTTETTLPCVTLTQVGAHGIAEIDLAPWKYSLFSEYGTYEVELPVPEGTEITANGSQYREGVIARFEIYEAGTITQLFRTFVSKPLLNALIFIASYLPDHNLGWAIIILTIIVKLLLFIPTQHAMEGQKKMQAVQPKLDAIKKKYKDDPKKMQEETMRIWKEEKINPFQSCLPMLIQFPILIGLFFTIRDGSILELSRHLIYSPYQDLSWTFGTFFFGLDLKEPSVYLMPPLLVVMQFIQMKLSFAMSDRKKKAKGDEATKDPQTRMQQGMMLYGLPLMIGFFAIRFPAAVSLYWGISTLFAIGQQLVVNRKA